MKRSEWILGISFLLGLTSSIGCGDDDSGGTGTTDAGSNTRSDGAAADAGMTAECAIDSSLEPTKFALLTTATSGGSATTAQQEQGPFFETEVNRRCGALGTAEAGRAVELLIGDVQDDADISETLTTDVISQGAKFIVGMGGSGPTTAGSDVAITQGVPAGAYAASSDALTSCTAAQMGDATVTKTASPTTAADSCWNDQNLFWRTAVNSGRVGQAHGDFILSDYSEVRRVVFYHRESTTHRLTAEAASAQFEAAGDGRTAVLVPFPRDATLDDHKGLFSSVVASDPEIIWTFSRVGEIKTFFEAFAELDVDATFTKPAGWDDIQFVLAGSIRTSYSDISAAAQTLMRTRAQGLVPHWDEATTGFQRWRAAFQAYDPDGEVTHHQQMRTYDMLMVFTLAMVKAQSDAGADIAGEVASVANPPGMPVYPDEYEKARSLILAGEDIDYQGASGSVDFDEVGNVTESPYQVWSIDDDGDVRDIRVFNP